MNEPSVKETAFSCPHCGAYTTQYWHSCYVSYIRDDPKVPYLPDADFEERVKASDIEAELKQKFIEEARKLRTKNLFTAEKPEYLTVPRLNNLFLSRCYNCKKWAVWVYEDIVYPPRKFGAMPNQDLPSDILAIVEEARSILDASGKGAAALLRLSIQKLCKHLGETGKDLNRDIANLIQKGLNPVVAKSLDVVRVIGNESVHPGSIDLNDNKAIAARLFDLVNIIAEQMITQPKRVEELYNKLPEAKRKAIEDRNTKVLQDKQN